MKKTLIFCVFLVNFYCFSQNNYNYLIQTDKLISNENLPFHKGLYFYDEWERDSNENNNRYFSFQNEKGNLEYNNQTYPNLFLKYDLVNDNILFFPTKDARTGILLVKETISAFSLNEKKFIKTNDYGFVQVLIDKNQTKLLLKSEKRNSDKIKNDKLVTQFYLKTSYFVEKYNNIYEIKGKSSLTKLFPSKKTEIANYYKDNKELLSKNSNEFYSNLLRKIL